MFGEGEERKRGRDPSYTLWQKIKERGKKKREGLTLLSKHSLYLPLALGIAAGGAVVTALGVDEHVRALRALTGHVLGEAVVLNFGLFIRLNVLFQHTGDGVRARKNRLTAFPGDGWTANAA